MSSTRTMNHDAASSDRRHKKHTGQHSDHHDHSTWLVRLPASRIRAITRGMLWAAPAVLLGVITFSIYSALDFSPTGVSNRLVEYGQAIFALVFPMGALWTAIKALRWFLMGCWPGPVGVFANDHELILALGPMGTNKYDVARLSIQYAFELSDDLTDEGYEAYLPEEEQIRLFLPCLTHPLTKGRINQMILDYVISDEESAAAAMRPAIEHWRSQQEKSPEKENQD